MFKLKIEPSDTLHTQWGTAKINNQGYYVITNRKYGCNMKKLHRLIFEQIYGEIPHYIHIHHKDCNPLNNCIFNLEPLSKSEHQKLHSFGKNNAMYGKKHSKETCDKMVQSRNKTGYYRVDKQKSNSKQGFLWRYQYRENDKNKTIARVNLKDLEAEVKNRGLEWRVLDEQTNIR